MKYKLIKTYPGSPELGTEVEQEKNWKGSFFYKSVDKRICVFREHVENNPEYWEKVNENLWYVVLEDIFYYNDGFRDTKMSNWHVYYVECLNSEDIERELWPSVKKHIFKTKEEAEEFILYNKPCLSYNDIMWTFKEDTKKNTISMDVDVFVEFVKSKL